jgi:peptidylprolyl isomerase
VAEPIQNSPGQPGDERAKMMRVLIPAGGIALVVILVAVIASMSGNEKKMSDGSNGTQDDPELKDIIPGVKYRDLKEGQGEACTPGAKVKMIYSVWLTDGSVVDSSKGAPAEFELDNLIPGWQYGVPGMKPGGIRKLVVSPDLAYGSRGHGKIPPSSTLIFEVELVSATQKAAPKLFDGTSPTADDPNLRDIGDGLKIRDLKEGTGELCPEKASVTVRYTGWLLNGVVFDSNKDSDPVTFALDEVIKGWTKGIPGMRVGGIRKLVIPADLAYGAQNKGKIPPNSTLIFEVELLGVK